MKNWFSTFAKDKEAATALEYAVIAGVLVVVLITVFTNLGGGIEDVFQGVVDKINPPAASGSTNANGV